MSNKKIRSPTRLFRQEVRKPKEEIVSEPNISVRLVSKASKGNTTPVAKPNSNEIRHSKGKLATKQDTLISTVTERGDGSRNKRVITEHPSILRHHEAKRVRIENGKWLQASSEKRYLDVAQHLKKEQSVNKSVVVQKRKLEVAIERIGAIPQSPSHSEQSFPEAIEVHQDKADSQNEKHRWRMTNVVKTVNFEESTISKCLKENTNMAKPCRWRVDGKRVQTKKKKPLQPAIKEAETDGVKIRPESSDTHTKPYYEAWVNTKLAAVNTEAPKYNNCISYFNKIEEKQTSERMQFDCTDERFTGRIKIRAKGLSGYGGKESVEHTL